MHYYIISGEPSGDLYGSKLIENLKKHNPNSKFSCWGGHYMESVGGQIVVDLESLSFMGFWEVFKNTISILKNLAYAKFHIKKTQPDALILIDYPGFNLRIAKYAKKIGIPVYWFIAPQIWAWKGNRIRIMQKYIDKLFVALPFELDYFKERGLETFYFGHPMLDIIQSEKQTDAYSTLAARKLIALLPGSRKQEIQKILPIMLGVLIHFPDYKFVIICTNNIKRSFYENLIGDMNVELKFNKDILSSVSAAIVASGTATLELAIYKIPQVVCYKLDFISFLLATIFARIKYISLVNILSDKHVVKELIQYNCKTSSIVSELSLILKENNASRIVSDYEKLINHIGPLGCFQKMSQIIYSDLLGIKKHANK
jgi:lipid-A-disaccharide synthase